MECGEGTLYSYSFSSNEHHLLDIIFYSTTFYYLFTVINFARLLLLSNKVGFFTTTPLHTLHAFLTKIENCAFSFFVLFCFYFTVMSFLFYIC